jgi:hypothetical protein
MNILLPSNVNRTGTKECRLLSTPIVASLDNFKILSL